MMVMRMIVYFRVNAWIHMYMYMEFRKIYKKREWRVKKKDWHMNKYLFSPINIWKLFDCYRRHYFSVWFFCCVGGDAFGCAAGCLCVCLIFVLMAQSISFRDPYACAYGAPYQFQGSPCFDAAFSVLQFATRAYQYLTVVCMGRCCINTYMHLKRHSHRLDSLMSHRASNTNHRIIIILLVSIKTMIC